MNIKQSLESSIKYKTTPLRVLLMRGSSIESVHNVHAVICDLKGRVLMRAGNAEYLSLIRSALKPFQALPFILSGASKKYNLNWC